MAITAYTGVMGSGKTYEVVGHVIAPALAAGRRVVTNIAGFNMEEAQAYCVEHLSGVPGKIGSAVVVTDEQVEAGSFFPQASASGVSIVQAGDLVVIDECWRFWGSDSKISDADLNFFRKHRHFTHPETGVACDLVVISQDIADINRKLKNVVELSFRAKKAKAVGLNSVYTVEMWEGPNQRRKSVGKQTRKYRPEIFPLYSSYSGAKGVAGKEARVDARQNMLLGAQFVIGFPIAFLVIGAAIWNASGFFGSNAAEASPEPGSSLAAEPVDPARFGDTASEPIRTASLDPSPTPGAFLPPGVEGDPSSSRPSLRVKPPLSSEWRLSGYIAVGERRVVILINSRGRLRYVSPAGFSFTDGRPTAGIVDGERITAWSGSLPGSAVSAPPAFQVGGLGR